MKLLAAGEGWPAGAAAVLSLLVCGAVEAGTVEPPFQIGGAYTVRVTSLKEARQQSTVRQQFDYSCGSAALATLLSHHYGHPVSEAEVLQSMLRGADTEDIRREGFSMLDMKHYLRSAGFEADGFEAAVAELEAAGLPAVAMINERGYPHFVVVKGVRRGRVLLADPASGLRAMAVADFEALRATPILFVIGNRRQGVVFNRDDEWNAVPPAPLAASSRVLLSLPGAWRSGSDF